MIRAAAIRAGLIALALAPSLAEAMDAAGFEAMTAGRTLHFTREGLPFGSEQFLPGRRTLWRFEGDQCQAGRWWPEGDGVCFSYDRDPTPICWDFRAEGDGHVAELLEGGLATGFTLRLDRIETAPLPCPGPEVGS